MGVKFITWAKNIDKVVNKIEENKFDKVTKVKYKIQKSKEIRYYCEDKNVRKYGKIRAIIIKRVKDERVGVIYTNDKTTDVAEIIQIMCTRWGEENFIKAMKLDYKFDYMPGYVTEEIEQPMVDNPEIDGLKEKRKKLTNKLNKYEVEFAKEVLKEIDKMVDNPDISEINLEEIKRKRIVLLADIAILKSQIELINQEIDKLPKRVRYDFAYGEKLVRFDYEKKRILDCIKVFSYMMEKKMCEILMEEHIPPKEVWTVLEMIIKRGAEIKLEEGKLKVKIKKFRDEAIEYAAIHLCKRMNEMEPYTLDKYKMPLYYEVE